MSKDQETVVEKVEEQDNGITVHSLESDMKTLGIDTGEEAPEVETKQEEESTTEPEKVETKPKKSRTQRRIERQARDNKTLRDENEKLKHDLEAQKPEETTDINIDDFDSYEEYTEALRTAPEKKEEKAPETPRVDPVAIKDIFDDGAADYKDFETKVSNKELILSEDLLVETVGAENPSDVLYYLASNPEESERISKLDQRHIIIEIANIEKNLDTDKTDTKVQKRTAAPKPISPSKGSSVKGLSLDDDDLTYEQHEELLNKAQRAKRGGFI